MPDKTTVVIAASNATKEWSKRVRAATWRVRVFTPFLDQALVQLLRKAQVASHDVTVVTNLTPFSEPQNYAAMLKALRALLKDGVAVYSLDRLHAKVLQADDDICIGSQNFTCYGAGSKEVTAHGLDSIAQTQIESDLDAWFGASDAVDLEQVERLIATLRPQMRAAAKAVDDLEHAAFRVLDELERERASSNSMRRRLGRGAARARQRSAGDRVSAWLEPVQDYQSLIAQRDQTLSEWQVHDTRGRLVDVSLEPLKFYPALWTDTGRMAMVRVAQSRITYVMDSVVNGAPVFIAGEAVGLEFSYPDQDLEDGNVVLVARLGAHRGYVTLRLFFDGDDLTILDVGQTQEWNPNAKGQRDAVAAKLANGARPTGLLKELVLDHSSGAGFRHDKNAAHYFDDGREYILEITTSVGGHPVLLISPAEEEE